MYGGGATLAGGYKAYFLTLDANYTTGAVQTDNGQIGNHEIYSITFTPRAGAIFSAGRGARAASGSAACTWTSRRRSAIR